MRKSFPAYPADLQTAGHVQLHVGKHHMPRQAICPDCHASRKLQLLYADVTAVCSDPAVMSAYNNCSFWLSWQQSEILLVQTPRKGVG